MAKYAFNIGDKVNPKYEKVMYGEMEMFNFSRQMKRTFIITERTKVGYGNGNGYEITDSKDDENTMAWVPEEVLKKVGIK